MDQKQLDERQRMMKRMALQRQVFPAPQRPPLTYKQPMVLTKAESLQTPENAITFDLHQHLVNTIRTQAPDDALPVTSYAASALANAAANNASNEATQIVPAGASDADALRNLWDTRIQFESRYRGSGDYTQGIIGYRLNLNGRSDKTGAIGINAPLANIVELVLGEFEIPNSLLTTQYIPQSYYEKHFREITLYIRELTMENIRNISEIRHHWTLKVIPTGRYIHCTPVFPSFVFSGPVPLTSTITFELRFNGYPLPMASDSFLNCNIYYENPLRVHCQAPHYMYSSGLGGDYQDAVIFYNETNTGTNHDDIFFNVLGQMIQVTSSTDFVCPYINAATWAGPATCNVFVVNRNIKMTINFRCWTQQMSNGMLLTSS